MISILFKDSVFKAPLLSFLVEYLQLQCKMLALKETSSLPRLLKL